mmetsp:Transcript_20004/g.24495  ORF Transcript_20004/g.24495 Transcript_20004/m.24495 type:complete len:318 (-) Transcript_20004:21-974(-)
MPPPSILTRCRHQIGRSLRETGQVLDRIGLRGELLSRYDHRENVNDPPFLFEETNGLSRHRTLMPLMRRGSPQLGVGGGIEGSRESLNRLCFVAPCASLIGSVRVGSQSSIWYGAVLRADACDNGMSTNEKRTKDWETKWLEMSDEERKAENQRSNGSEINGGMIVIGEGTNVQDGVIVSAKLNHTIIGDWVTIGHNAQIHSARIDSNVLIGMGSIINDNVHIKSNSFIGAGAVISKGTTVPSGELWLGNPARKFRDLTDEEIEKIGYQAEEYAKLSMTHTDTMELGGNMKNLAVTDGESGSVLTSSPNSNVAEKVS